MQKLSELKPLFSEFIPNRVSLEHGILYISETYGTSTHLCPCGCGQLVVLPFKPAPDDFYWGYTNKEGLVSFNPSIGNWCFACQSHYYIKENKIIWC